MQNLFSKLILYQVIAKDDFYNYTVVVVMKYLNPLNT